MERILGIEIDLHPTLDAETLRDMTDEEIRNIYEEDGGSEEYTIEGFFRYLNNDQIDTENYWWCPIGV